jgi:two-component system cell cycle sensor histidine kinase/response regulator CckA
MSTQVAPRRRADPKAKRERVDRARLRLLELPPATSLRELLTTTLDLAEELTGSRIGFFHFVEDDQATLRLQAWSSRTTAGMCTAEGAGQHYPLGQAGVWADCVRTGRPVVHNDFSTVQGKRGLPAGHARVERELTVPVRRDSRTCAVLGVGNKATSYDDGDVTAVSTLADLAWDLAARKRAEEALRATEQELRLQQERMDLAASSGRLGLWDLDLVTNQAWRSIQHDRLFGYDRLQETWGPEEALRHVVPEDRPIFQRAFEEAYVTGHFHYELRINPVNRPQRWIQADGQVYRDGAGQPVRMMGTVVDVTERKTLSNQLAVASRLAALGTLVAGVAHEINNPLVVETANQSLALEALGRLLDRLRSCAAPQLQGAAGELEEIIAGLEEAQAGSLRIARIVKDLMVFRQPLAGRARLRLVEVVGRAVGSLPADFTRHHAIEVQEAAAPDVIAVSAQLERVVANLVANALKATPVGSPEPILIRVAPGGPGLARLEVIDRGVGIDPITLERIFEPFFTTRDVGQGMGLGLAICHAIVASHGGSLTAISAVGQGSTFRMELPAAGEA